MPVCANCKQEYPELFDGCPTCTPELTKSIHKARSSLGTISTIMVLLLLVTLLATFTSCMNGLPTGL